MRGYDPDSNAQTPGTDESTKRRRRKRRKTGESKSTDEGVGLPHDHKTVRQTRKDRETGLRRQQSQFDKQKHRLLAVLQRVTRERVQACLRQPTESFIPLYDTFWRDIPVAQPEVATVAMVPAPPKVRRQKRVFVLCGCWGFLFRGFRVRRPLMHARAVVDAGPS